MKCSHSNFLISVNRLRRDKNYTYKKLSNLTGLNQSYINDVFLGNSLPNEKFIDKLANIFEVSKERVLGITTDVDLKKQKLISNINYMLENNYDRKFVDDLFETIMKKEGELI